jgi:hypothetical protein
MLFADEFVESLKDDPIGGARKVCQLAFQQITSQQGWSENEYEALLEAEILLTEMSIAGLIPFKVPGTLLAPNAPLSDKASSMKKRLDIVLAECDKYAELAHRERLQKRFRNSMGVTFAYEFSQGDLERIQSLLNDLRGLVSAATGFADDHQRRLLKRLEAMQSELHKRVSDLDRFWGFVGEAGVVLAKLGNDAKPIVDRVREIADIVWNTQGRAEELPSGAKPPQIGYQKLPPDGEAKSNVSAP